jgi:deoxyribodipyrimidine photo-lyase
MDINPCQVFWFRRDLRLFDNRALFEALSKPDALTLPIFIFDTNILEGLLSKSDPRVVFIHQQLSNIKQQLIAIGKDLRVFYGQPSEVWKELTSQYNVKTVFYNADFEPYGIQRDKEVTALLAAKGIDVQSFTDHLIFHPSTVLKADKSPYTVFTPYKKQWLLHFEAAKASALKHYDSESLMHNFMELPSQPLPTLNQIGFTDSTDYQFPSAVVDIEKVKHYATNRDLPDLDGTTHLGIHLRFGTLSLRQLIATTLPHSDVYLSELIWREFYAQILYHFPQIVGQSFRPIYDKIAWQSADSPQFNAWCQGLTGYPIVDAGMRQLNTTGYMHNRVRMIVASFLTKHLLIDWRFGEAYFAEKLLDFDLASNNGGWQWAAGCGTDAAPYFRIFNPTTQQQKFDPQFKYIRRYVPEFDSLTYPSPIINHDFARKRCLETYKATLNTKETDF